ncbi:MAG: PhoH family protein [Tissierellia bacterium]|nr:PhoH family protein [Tissierellia bacterium]
MTKKISEDNMFFGLNLTDEQREYRDSMYSGDYDIIFCNSVAGTGKTLIAVATAKLLIGTNGFDGLVYIISPTMEQKQGFLPGSLNEKTMPYGEPLEQALIKIGEQPEKAIKQYSMAANKKGTGWVDCISHTFLRGVNFENKIVIVDEMQNAYLDECKKILTRCADNCRIIAIGHSGQIDITKYPERSGFDKYIEHFKDMKRCKVCNLTRNFRGWVSTHADKL